MTEQNLEDLIERAAKRGAAAALAEIGLGDENASEDVREVRRLLDSWRQVKKGILQGFGRWLLTFFLIVLAYGAGRHNFAPTKIIGP